MILESRLILDACAVQALIDDGDPRHEVAREVFFQLLPFRPDRFLVSALTVYESRRGLLRDNHRARLARVEQFFKAYTQVVEFDETAAYYASTLWSRTGRTDRSKGEIDLMVLATASLYRANVVTYDKRFPRTEDVQLLTWEQLVT